MVGFLHNYLQLMQASLGKTAIYLCIATSAWSLILVYNYMVAWVSVCLQQV